jgi:hypothetical protein
VLAGVKLAAFGKKLVELTIRLVVLITALAMTFKPSCRTTILARQSEISHRGGKRAEQVLVHHQHVVIPLVGGGGPEPKKLVWVFCQVADQRVNVAPDTLEGGWKNVGNNQRPLVAPSEALASPQSDGPDVPPPMRLVALRITIPSARRRDWVRSRLPA